LAATGLSQNGGASQEGKQSENYRVFHISSPFNLKAEKGWGKANALTLRTLDWLKVAKYFFL